MKWHKCYKNEMNNCPEVVARAQRDYLAWITTATQTIDF
jgi:hypothetical protein